MYGSIVNGLFLSAVSDCEKKNHEIRMAEKKVKHGTWLA